MPFAFGQIEPRSSGYVEAPPVPLTRFLGASWDQGINDSIAGSVYRASELWQVDHDFSFFGLLDQQAGRMLSADEANRQFGNERLRFDQPIHEGAAQLIRERQDRNEVRAELLSNGATSTGRVALSFGVSMLAQLSNPADFASMFMPIVGSEAMATRLTSMGIGPMRTAMARGLITEERLRQAVPVAPKLIAAAIEGSVGQAVAEVPLYIANRMDKTPYTLQDSVVNVLAGGAFAAGVRLGIEGIGRILQKLRPETHEAMARKAMEDFLQGKDTKVQDLVKVDENVIRDKVKFDVIKAEAEARKTIDSSLSDIRAWAESQLDNTGTLGSVDQPNLVKIAQNWLPIWEQQGKDTTIAKRLLERVLGGDTDLITLQNLATQFNLQFDPKERNMPGVYHLAEPADRQRMQKRAGVADEDLKIPGQLTNAQRRMQAAQLDVQRRANIEKLVAEEKDRRVKDLLEKLRQEYDPALETRRKVNAEIQEQQQQGRVLSDEQVAKYKMSNKLDESDVAVLEKDVEDLKATTGEATQQSADTTAPTTETPPPRTVVDQVVQAIEKLKIDIKGDNIRHSGIPPETWNTFVDSVIAAVRMGEKLYLAVERALRGLDNPQALREKVYSKWNELPFYDAVAGDLHSSEYLTANKRVINAAIKHYMDRLAAGDNPVRAAMSIKPRDFDGFGDDIRQEILLTLSDYPELLNMYFSPGKRLTMEENLQRQRELFGSVTDVAYPKKGTTWYNGRAHVGATDQLLWTTSQEEAAKAFLTGYRADGQQGDSVGVVAKLTVAKDLNPATHLDVMAAQVLATGERPLAFGALDPLYDKPVVDVLKSWGFDSAYSLDPLESEEIPTTVLFDPRKQVVPVNGASVDMSGKTLARLGPDAVWNHIFGTFEMTDRVSAALRNCIL